VRVFAVERLTIMGICMETIFVPVICNSCKRHSVVSFARVELKRLLGDGDSIELRCAYDDHAWAASSRERDRMLKLVRENDAVERIAPRRAGIFNQDTVAF
jgi:hypothetical protein